MQNNDDNQNKTSISTETSESQNTQSSAAIEDANDGDTAHDYSKDNLMLEALLPRSEGFEWKYFGFAEYGHRMKLDEIFSGNGIKTYKISGMVDDMSAGEADGDFSIQIQYIISEGEFKQIIKAEKVMDSEFPNLILIKPPLVKNSKWTQKVANKDNVQVELDCTIKDIKDDGLKTYVVRYEQKDSDYYEIREISEGTGVVGVTRLFVAGGDKFEIGYNLYDLISGYPQEMELKSYLPPFATELRYFGIAEYAHVVKWDKTYFRRDQKIFEFNGHFEDGSGIPGNFRVDYLLDLQNFTITESVVENTRSGQKIVNSILQGLIILKSPVRPGTSWQQEVSINGKTYVMNALIVEGKAKDDDPDSLVYTVRYTVDGIPGYYNQKYIQERRFQTGKGMITFSQLMEGDIGLSGKELEDELLVEQALANHMFGYSLDISGW